LRFPDARILLSKRLDPALARHRLADQLADLKGKWDLKGGSLPRNEIEPILMKTCKCELELEPHECTEESDRETTRQSEPEQLQPTLGVEGTVALAPWYALRVRPNYEKPVAAALRGKGFREFLPLVQRRRQWSDRVKVMDLPLFPGYLFCRLNLEERMPLLTTPGFLYLVGVGKNPEPVDESEIAAIQCVLRSGLVVTPWPSLVVGQRVQLRHGPLRGLEGVLTKIANQHRMYVSVTLLKRSISVEVAPEWIHPIDAAKDSAPNSNFSSEA
jgi:transcription antitermination factor NusG